jgi:hypothetical protein
VQTRKGSLEAFVSGSIGSRFNLGDSMLPFPFPPPQIDQSMDELELEIKERAGTEEGGRKRGGVGGGGGGQADALSHG